jgi:tight adherence protein C
MASPFAILVVFLITTAVIVLAALFVAGRNERVHSRLKEIAVPGPAEPAIDQSRVAQLTHSTLEKMGAPLLPDEESQRTLLQTRLIHAGLYGSHALVTFLGVKMLLMALPVVVGLGAALFGATTLLKGVCYGLYLGIAGMLGPSFWLASRKAKRQAALRRALPDTLDVIVICLEGGLSLAAALQRVVAELRVAHPLLASEMGIVEREIIVGRSTGEALRHFADRCDLEDVRTLASVVIQSERFGASLVKTLRQHSEGLRMQRLLRGEEMAQKASVKIVFPTLLFIFPAVFLVLAGPAMFQVWEMMASMQK